jgi:FemAB-related protein (PEP-CTERM system-associated)
MRDLGTPVYPKRFFRAILDRFPDCTWIVTIYGQGGPMASGFLASFKDRVEIPWGASLHKFNALSPNMLLYWSCLEFACSQGFRVFDFGRSTVGEGTYRFKEQWGAEPSPMNWHYWMADAGTLPEINPRNPKYRLAIAMWKKLPVPLTKLLGPSIVRNIP